MHVPCSVGASARAVEDVVFPRAVVLVTLVNFIDIFCNEDAYKGFLLITGDAKVIARNDIIVGIPDYILRTYHGTTVYAYGNSTVYAKDNSTVATIGNSTVYAYGNSTVYAKDNSTVYAYDNSTVYAYGDSTVDASGNSTVYAYENAKVEAYGNDVKVIDKRPSPEPSNPTPEKEEKEPTELDIAEFLLHELVELLKKLGLFEKLAAYYREKHKNIHP